jgi:hypothetical protein
MTLTTEWRLYAPGGFGRRTSSPTRGTLPTSSNGTCHLCPRPSSNVTQLGSTVGAVVDDFFATGTLHSFSRPYGSASLAGFCPLSIMARRTGIEPASLEVEVELRVLCQLKLAARALRDRKVLVSTTAVTLAHLAPVRADAIGGQALHPARFLKSQSKQRTAMR